MGLNGEIDLDFIETRTDHHELYGVRYVLSSSGSPVQPHRIIGDVIYDHAVHEWLSCSGYFSLIRVAGCWDAWKMDEQAFKTKRKDFVRGNMHSQKAFARIALSEQEKCDATSEQLDKYQTLGMLGGQAGSIDHFSVSVQCRSVQGCTVLLKVSYHPNWRVLKRKGSKFEPLPAFHVSPSYLAFFTPAAESAHTYHILYSSSTLDTWLFKLSYGMIAIAIIAECILRIFNKKF